MGHLGCSPTPVFYTFAFACSPLCSGINSSWLFVPTFDAHRVLSSKTTQRCHREDQSSVCTFTMRHRKNTPIMHQTTSQQTKPSPPSMKVQNTKALEKSPKCNSTSQITHPPAHQGRAKLLKGLNVNLPHEHHHQHICLQKTQSSVRYKSMIGIKKPRKKKQQQRRKS
jgi:hypothetical protein